MFIAIIILVALLFSCWNSEKQPVRYRINPAKIVTRKNLTETQKTFLADFLPEIYYENELILLDRKDVENYLLKIRKNKRLKGKEKHNLNRILLDYRMKRIPWDTLTDTSRIIKRIDSLMYRVDIIPVRLTMAQAIIESGWGNSRFAKDGNNYFGIHCFSPGCGMKPGNHSGNRFEVMTFPSRTASIQYYFRTLNTGYAYEGLRKIRANLRKEGKNPDPFLLMTGLDSYSQIGDSYDRLITKIIQDYLPQDIPSLLEPID
ncbi:MAG: glucosaminidase domain-containing protein [Bacteroidetes bacterium]|nr:glucosaminidase domain-containing protein [Bacteroidota bacterium]